MAVGPLEPKFYAEFVRLLDLAEPLPERTDVDAVAGAAAAASPPGSRSARQAEWTAVFAD